MSKMTKGFYYFCESYGGWFVCFADNKREAVRCTKLEYGDYKEVRRATTEEVENYCEEKGIDQLGRWAWIMGKTEVESKEANRRFQMKA